MEGVTSLGCHLRPACNQGLLEIQLNKKNMTFDLNTVCSYRSRLLGASIRSVPLSQPFPLKNYF